MKREIFVLLLSLLLTGCGKETAKPRIEERPIEMNETKVTFNWTVFYSGKLCSMVEISLNADMSNATRYGSEEETSTKTFEVSVTGLKPVTQYYYCYLVKVGEESFRMNNGSFTTLAGFPIVETVAVTEATRTTATVSCKVVDDSSSEVTERGVCWGTNSNPTIGDNHVSEGQGIGAYTVTITDLAVQQTYFVRAYATNKQGTAYGEELSFTTNDAEKPIVTTLEVTDIDWRTATVAGEVTNDWDAEVTERGVCWSTAHNPEISGSHASDGAGLGSFTVNMTDLIAGTNYYVRAYAKNMAGVGYGNEMSFVTKEPELCVVTVDNVFDITCVSASVEGTVETDGGVDVTERGFCWSTSPLPTVSDHHVVSGAGLGYFSVTIADLMEFTEYHVRAYAINVKGVSYSEDKSFVTNPMGAVNGLFSVSDNEQVYFSQGNLQFNAKKNEWRFAPKQYDIIANDNSYLSQNYNGWIDLFGWATSGWNSGALCYTPWSSSDQALDYHDGGETIYNLTDDHANGDWGVYNPITNGGGRVGLWRTLTHDEWIYVFETRQASTVNGTDNARYAMSKVAGKRGVIVFPDVYTHPSNMPKPKYINDNGVEGLSVNDFSESDWEKMEQQGAVFLPFAGHRNGTWINNPYFNGNYWSSTAKDSYTAYCMYMDDEYGFYSDASQVRCYGLSVRLVRDVK